MHPHSPQTPAPMQVLELATASWMSQALSTAAALGVADELVHGPRTVEEIAEEVDAHAPTLYRVLRALTDLGVFRETEQRVFTLTPLSKCIVSDAPNSMRNFAMLVGMPADRHAWVDLTSAVRTGRSAFVSFHGKAIFDYCREDPEFGRVFDNAMTEASNQIIAPIVDAYDFGSLGTIVDVGGGHGALLAAVLADNPYPRGILFDQPEVIAEAGGPFERAGVNDRCELRSGDFFASVPEGGDAYFMSDIIHDWDDENALRILVNCREAMTDGGRVLLAEATLPDTVTASHAKLMDLAMLVHTAGGRQRSVAEFGELFERAGLKLSRVISAGGPFNVIEAVRS